MGIIGVITGKIILDDLTRKKKRKKRAGFGTAEDLIGAKVKPFKARQRKLREIGR